MLVCLTLILTSVFTYAAYQMTKLTMQSFKNLLDRNPWAAAGSVGSIFLEIPIIILGLGYLMHIIIGYIDPAAAQQSSALYLVCFGIACLVGMVKGLM